ncbi:3628_t:CDS:10 [Paraglomus occultum]|uniref:3628_t:CDS:1 n=1 Tax=Paraglomus occultum TaxID=144539 RepID=A0A9N8Z135_9GLOM|nr:3628_t:CDS:10 [Paraglomus occultum]
MTSQERLLPDHTKRQVLILHMPVNLRIKSRRKKALPQQVLPTDQLLTMTCICLIELLANELFKDAMEILKSIESSSKENARKSNEDESDISISSLLPLPVRVVVRVLLSLFSMSGQTTDDSRPKKSFPYQPLHPHLIAAVKLLSEAGLGLGHDDSLFTLAEMNFVRHRTRIIAIFHPRNLNQAFYYYKQLADRSGNATAQQMVGFMYATGIGVVQRDQAKALVYHTFAALGHDVAAEMTLGYRYYAGIGVSPNCEDSLFYYERVADKAVEYYRSGPPLGRQLPPLKLRLSDKDGGVYGEGASGSSLRPQLKPIDSATWNDILDYYRYLANNNDIKAQLGRLFYTGIREIPQDFSNAHNYLLKVARRVWPSDEGKEKLPAKPDVIRKAAKAAGLLGRLYWRGEGVAQDNNRALFWFWRGAKEHDSTSLACIGIMFLEGVRYKDEILVEQNFDKAKEFLTAASENDDSDADAQVYLGLLHLRNKDLANAKKRFEQAAEHAHFLAYYHLGQMYAKGLGAPKSCESAVILYKNVAERGDWLHSPFSAATEAYEAGDEETALLYFMLAAERGYEIAQANVAWLLDPGREWLISLYDEQGFLNKAKWKFRSSFTGDVVREKLALIYWTRAAIQGNLDAKVKRGDYYFNGIGTDIDYKKAKECYYEASSESAIAMWNLGWIHESGIGVTQDFDLAKRWYDRSLASNPAAYLPVTLSLLKLSAHRIWNYLNGGDNSIINSDDVDDSEILNEVRHRPKGQQREGVWDSEEEKLLKDYNKRNKGDDESGYSTESHDDHDYPEEKKQEEDVVETLMILAMCLLVGFLVYIRQLRWNQENNRARGQGRVDGNERNRDGRGHQNGGNRWIDRFANLAEFVQ